MARFEEEVVERWYALQGCLTAKNVGYPSPARRPGGKGRGEINLLAVRLGKGGKVEDRVLVEVSVSVTTDFPFISRSKPEYDDARRILKKFL